MPSERRKEQNRINQRRYRLQIKNRIQVLEKVIFDARSAAGPNPQNVLENPDSGNGALSVDGSQSSNLIEPDKSDCLANFEVREHEQERELETLWNLNQNPDSFDSAAELIYRNTFEPWPGSNHGYSNGTETSPDSSTLQQVQTPLISPVLHVDAQYFTPLPQGTYTTPVNLSSTQKLPTPPSSSYLGDSTDYFSGSLARSTRVNPKKTRQSNQQGDSQKQNGLSQRSPQSKKGSIVASLRAENKRLRELSAALVNIYDFKKPNAEKAYLSNQETSDSWVDDHVGQRPSSNNANETLSYGSDFHTPAITDGVQIEQFSSPVTFDPNKCHTLHPMPLDESPDFLGCFENSAPLYTQAKEQTSHQQLHPRHPCTTNSYSTYQSHSPSLFLQTIPIPSSYDQNEPSFSRRLLRKCFQIGYHILINRHVFPPSLINRVFDFCFVNNSVEKVTEKLRICLGLGAGGEMVADQLRWGLLADRRDVDGNERKEWMEVGDVEGWLGERGFFVNGENLVPQLSVEKAELDAGKKAPIVPYGTVWNPATGENGEFDAQALLKACFNPLSMESHGVYSSSQVCLNAGTGQPREIQTSENVLAQNYLNIDDFLECLTQHSVCLGRTAGFRRKEVEGVLENCLAKI